MQKDANYDQWLFLFLVFLYVYMLLHRNKVKHHTGLAAQ